LPGLFVPLTAGGVSAVAGMTFAEFTAAMQSNLAPAGRLSLLSLLLLGVVAALGFLRIARLRVSAPRPAPATVTWGCGYARPSPSMQYTASSFAWPLIQSFRHILWPHRKVVSPVGPFARHAELETHTPDVAQDDFFAPLLRGFGRAFRMFRTVSWSGEFSEETRSVETGGRVGPLHVLIAGVVTALRHGRIHVYMAFIVLTLLSVFFIELLSSHDSSASPVAPAMGVFDGASK